jgi:hypothetical protein
LTIRGLGFSFTYINNDDLFKTQRKEVKRGSVGDIIKLTETISIYPHFEGD